MKKISHKEFHNYIQPMINGVLIVLSFAIGYLVGFMS